MTREQILNKIREELAIFETEIRLANSADEYDINRHSETMLIPILDIVFSCSFQNLNYTEKKNYPAIDLGDPEKGLAVQVTSTGTRRKVTDCLDLFNKYEQGKTYSSLLFYFLAEPQKKISLSSEAVIKRLGSLEPKRIQFFSNKTLYDRLHDFRTDQLKDVLDILEKEYPGSLQSSSPVSLTPFPPYDHNADLPGRNKFFTDLKASLLHSYPVIVLTGPAGTGKTYAAARLCHDIKIDKLGSTAWVTYSGDLKSDLLALDLFKDHDSAHRADRITDHLKTVSEPLYLFIDNNK